MPRWATTRWPAHLAVADQGVDQVDAGGLDGYASLALAGHRIVDLFVDQLLGRAELVLLNRVHARHRRNSSEIEVKPAAAATAAALGQPPDKPAITRPATGAATRPPTPPPSTRTDTA